jgi:hypothetical protein
MAMHKQMISLTHPQLDYLKKAGDYLGVPVSSVIRRMVDYHKKTHGATEEEETRGFHKLIGDVWRAGGSGMPR